MANNIINRVCNKGVKINNINNTNEFIYINKVGDNTYEIKINVRNINTNVKNNKIYKLKIITK